MALAARAWITQRGHEPFDQELRIRSIYSEKVTTNVFVAAAVAVAEQ